MEKNFRAKNDEKGLTVAELHAIFTALVENGYGENIVYERRFDQPMRYVEVSETTRNVSIMEAY